jgi:transitional endoplasmic reticulum ATPase
MPTLSPDAELHFTRGLLHLRRGEAVMPLSMAIREEKAPAGTDVILALLGLATVATSRAIGQTKWIEEYRAEMRTALDHFDRALDIAPQYAAAHFRKAQTHRHLGENEAALQSARLAVDFAPNDREFGAFLRVLDGGTGRRSIPATPPVAQGTLTWDDVILPAKTKRELRQMQLILENPEQARGLGVEPPTGLLLYGPPGTGKTTVARVLAAQAKCRFFTTSAADVNNMWMGESEKAVARLFHDARLAAPSIIFLDEVDALIGNRSGGMMQYSDKVVNQFLHEMDGIKPNQGVFVVAATNRPDMLDAALIRGGRLSRQIEIPLPDTEARLAILKLNLRAAQIEPTVDIDVLAMRTEGFSGADLRALVNEAGMQALIRIADDGGSPMLTAEDFATGIANLRRED